MVVIHSATKGLAAMTLALAHSRGWLDYDARVTTYWPEFGQRGKDTITVRQLLAHQAGLFAFDEPVDRAVVADLDRLAMVMARQSPAWPPGTRQAYHALTLGFYEGELLRRVDPAHRSLGQSFQDEIATPLSEEVYIRLPDSIPDARLASLAQPRPLDMLRMLPLRENSALAHRQKRSLHPRTRQGAIERRGGLALPVRIPIRRQCAGEVPIRRPDEPDGQHFRPRRWIGGAIASRTAAVRGVPLVRAVSDHQDIAVGVIVPDGEDEVDQAVPSSRRAVVSLPGSSQRLPLGRCREEHERPRAVRARRGHRDRGNGRHGPRMSHDVSLSRRLPEAAGSACNTLRHDLEAVLNAGDARRAPCGAFGFVHFTPRANAAAQDDRPAHGLDMDATGIHVRMPR